MDGRWYITRILDPLVIYGCVANGPDFHLSLILNQTNNNYAIDNNTSSWNLLPCKRPNQTAIDSLPTLGTSQVKYCISQWS